MLSFLIRLKKQFESVYNPPSEYQTIEHIILNFYSIFLREKDELIAGKYDWLFIDAGWKDIVQARMEVAKTFERILVPKKPKTIKSLIRLYKKLEEQYIAGKNIVSNGGKTPKNIVLYLAYKILYECLRKAIQKYQRERAN